MVISVSFLLFFVGCVDKSAVRMDIDEDDFEAEFASNDEFDPLSGYNRAITTFNDAAYRYAIIPVVKGYAKIVPSGARDSINNFFDNLIFPVRFANNLLQGKFSNAASETGRFIINTTVGFLGFANVADEIYGMQKHDEDFGQTLGVWGVPSGPHVVLPILGPSNVRDIGGFAADYLLTIQYKMIFFENIWQNNGLSAFETFNGLADFMPLYETMTKDAIDLYPFMKNAYEQRRDKLIKE
jgi:phospholipid-binding lipoprotein MlaA